VLFDGTSFNVSGYSGYKNFTKDNFICELSAGFNGSGRSTADNTGYQNWVSTSFSVSFTKTYNASTGVLSVSYSGSSTGSKYALNAHANGSGKAHVYLVIGKIS
jgi:hypothetical protein